MDPNKGVVSEISSQSQISEVSEHPSTTTISTVAVQAGKAKIVLAILRSNDWIRVRIQQMEPDLMEVGSSLEEAKALRAEHDELLMKLNMKQKDVTELLARADDIASQNKSYQEVYAAMANSLAEAWKDLNTQLEYRQMLLDQSITFHQSAHQFSLRMQDAQARFTDTGMAQDVDTARRMLQQHTDIKKGILESSMSTLSEGQSLLDRIREMGMRADVQNRHATTAACYGIEYLLELLQDRRRHLEELWAQRKIKLEQCLQLLLLDSEVLKLSDWFTKVGDVYLEKRDLGENFQDAQSLQDNHYRFEAQAREIHETVLRLVRTADQLMNSATYDAEGIKQRLKNVDTKCEEFMHKLDRRRKNLAMSTSFFSLAQTALTKLGEIEVQLNNTDLPRNSAALAEKHAQLSALVVEVSTPAIREGRILLERVGREDSSVQGVNKTVTALQEKCTQLEEMCKARYEAGEKSQAYNQFQEKFSTLSTWLAQIGLSTLSFRRDMGIDVYSASDFLELHQRLEKDMKDKSGDVKTVSEAAEALVKSGDPEAAGATEKVKGLKEQWDLVTALVDKRIKLAQSYVSFHRKAQQLAIKMDALEQYVKIEKMDATTISEQSVTHKEKKYSEMSTEYKVVEGSGKAFIKQATEDTKDKELDIRRAVAIVESLLFTFSERVTVITEYYEVWKVFVTTGKEFTTQWKQFITAARKTIDWVLRLEDDFFPLISGDLGTSKQDAAAFVKKLEDFVPTCKKAQNEIEDHLKTAEMLSLKGDTKGGKDQIINELLKVHTRFQARINEYQILLTMTTKFFENLGQLDKLIDQTEKDFSQAAMPNDLEKARTMLTEHTTNRDKMIQLINFSSDEGEKIVVRVRQQDSEAIAKDEVQKVLQMTEERRAQWERSWEDQRNRLEQHLQVCQFYFDLKQIHRELDELNNQLDSRHGSYGSSLMSVKMTSDAFKQFENSAVVVESKVNSFNGTAEKMIREKHYDSRRIRYEVDGVQKKWEAFRGRISEYRTHLDESTLFFELLDKCEEWFHGANQFLLQVGRKATECKTSDDAGKLIKELDDYRKDGAVSQDEKLGEMYRYIVNLYGQVQGPPKMQATVDKNQEILDNFLKAMKELGVLRENLVKKEEIMAEMEAVVEAKAPKVPTFAQPLQNCEITEGQKFTFECRLECDQAPRIEWYKDDVLLKSPDYKTTYQDGHATLTIEETFGEDTATYMCRARTDGGLAETSAFLKVKETRQKTIPPEFTKLIKDCELPEGTQIMFECMVSGMPIPTINWFKGETNIDNSPDYVITKINGTCVLKIRKLTKEHAGEYCCKATNPGGEAITKATLGVISVKKPHFNQPLTNLCVPEGRSVRLEAHYTGEPAPSMQWLHGDKGILPSAVFRIIVEPTFTALEINEVYPEDAGTYTVVAKNLGGEVRTSCNLSVDAKYLSQEYIESQPCPPKFTQHLKDKDTMEGSRARLDCIIVARPEPEVIWYHNDKPVKESKDFQLLFEGDRCSLVIREVYLEDSGDYRCVAKNIHGSAESKCRLNVEPLSELSDASATSGGPADIVPPKFTQLLKDLEGVEGREVRFDCRVIGHPNPVVKWFRENVEIFSSPDFQITVQRELQSLIIPEVLREDAGNFMCRATNMAGEAKCYASLVVKPAVEQHAIKTRLIEEAHTIQKTDLYPQQVTTAGVTHAPPEFKNVFNDMRVRQGGSAKFEVIITGNPKPRVRWLFNNDPIVSPDYQVACYGDVYSLYIPEVFDEDAGRFSIIAENDSGKATCSALLEVVDDVTAPAFAAPYSPRPSPRTVPQHPSPMIQPVQAQPVQAAAPPAPPPWASAPKPKPKPVELPVVPSFMQRLKDVGTEEGKRVILEAVVDGKPEPEVKWYHNGKELTSSPDFQITYKNHRATLIIPEVFEEDAGTYEVVVHNEAGTQRSKAELKVQASMVPPEFAERIQTREVREGESVRFTCHVAGRPPPEVTWYREGSQIISSPDFEVIKEGDRHSLYIPEAFYEDSGKFSVKAENPAGQCSCTAELIVEAPSAIEESASPSPPVSRSPSTGTSPERAPPKLVQRPPQFNKPLHDQHVKEGQRVVLECIVNPYPEPERVQWFRNGTEIQSCRDYQISYSNGICTLIIAEIFPEDAGTFTCTVTVGGLPNSTNMYLDVEAAPSPEPEQPPRAPVFDAKLTNQPLTYGATAYFECKVSGYPPPEILWTRKGHPLVDKTRYKSTYDQYTGVTTLTILNLRDEDEGEYSCTALNTQGETSTSAMLLATGQYQNWLQQDRADKEKDQMKGQRRAVVSELEQRLDRPVTPSRAGQFYRPPSERMLDRHSEARMSDSGEPSDTEFKVSSFEQRLHQEVAFRDGKVDPRQMPHAPVDNEAFDESAMANAFAPQFEQKLQHFKLIEGSDATFVSRVVGIPRPSIQWFHNGRLLKPGQRYEMKITKEGFCTLRIRVAFPEDAGHYTCCATNIIGRDMCSAELYNERTSRIDDTSYIAPATLNKMLGTPTGSRRGSRDLGGVSEKYFKPIFRRIPPDQEATESQMVRFDCIVSGRPPPELFWYRGQERVMDDDLHKIVVNEDGQHSLIIYSTHTYDSGLYTCIAKNRGGEDRFQVTLNVQARAAAEIPRFVQRMANQAVKAGDSVTLTAEAVGVPIPMMSWSKDNRMIESGQRYIITTNGSVSMLYIPCVQPDDGTWFQCNAVNIAGSASNRCKLNVTVERVREPERKLVIPKRTTPKRPSSVPPQQRQPAPPAQVPTSADDLDYGFEGISAPEAEDMADAILDAMGMGPPSARDEPPAPAPRTPSTAEIQLSQPALVRPEPIQMVQAPPPVHAPPTVQPVATRPAQFAPAAPKPFKPEESPLMDYIKEADKARPVEPPAPVVSEVHIPRPSTKDLIDKGLEAAPAEEDMFNKDHPRPPKFKSKPRNQPNLVESQPAHFECRLVPIGDPNMSVDWYRNGQLLLAGHRFRPTYDFGYCALDILYTYPEDDGVYMCLAKNLYGQDNTSAELHCQGKISVIEDTQLPEGMDSLREIENMEACARRDMKPKKRRELLPDNAPPVFDLMPEPVRCEEGETAKFLVKISGFPRPRLQWWVNGSMVVSAQRFRLRYDGMMHSLEIPKCREYDTGTIRCVAKNPLGEAECSTSLTVVPQEDWRARLKHGPKSLSEVELEKRKGVELRSYELDQALKKPKTTVVELRQFERTSHEKAQQIKDREVLEAYQSINLRHSQMHQTGGGPIAAVEPHIGIDSEVHVARAKYMLGVLEDAQKPTDVPRIPRVKFERKEPPTFTMPLRAVKVKEGQGAKMEVSFTGFPNPDITWFREGQQIIQSQDFSITTANGRSFLWIPQVYPEDAGMFTARASNQFGLAECKAMLTVSGPSGPDTVPEFRVQMRDIKINVGEPATFDCQITGSPAPEVFWTKNGQRVAESQRWKFINEEDHVTFLIYEVQQTDSGLYECIIMNKLGRTHCSARLTVSGTQRTQAIPMDMSGGTAPQLLTTLKDATVDEGNPVSFQCMIQATPTPVVQWYYNNQVIKPSKYFLMKTEGNIHTLTIAGAFPEDEGVYKCVAYNPAGEVTCIAHLKVNSALALPGPQKNMVPPSFAKSIAGLDVKDQMPARFEAEVAGTPAPQVTWFREGQQIQQGPLHNIQVQGNRHVLLIKKTHPRDTGVITCRATNPAGVAECSAELYVEDKSRIATGQVTLAKGPPPQPPTILKAPSPLREVQAGSTTKIVVQLAAYPPPRFTWLMNGQEIKPTQRFKTLYEQGIVTLMIYNVQPQDSGDYILRASNELGECTWKTTLNIKPTEKVVQIPQGTQEVSIISAEKMDTVDAASARVVDVAPVFLSPLPPETTVNESVTARLEVHIKAVPVPQIVWLRNGQPIKPSVKYTIMWEGDKSVLLVKNITKEDMGTYTCRAISDLGEAVCSTTLYIIPKEPQMGSEPPRFLLPLQSCEAFDGEEVVLTCTVTGRPKPEVSWFHNEKNIDQSEDFVLNYNRETGKVDCVIVECLPDDQGVFKCIASNEAGQAVTDARLTWKPAPPKPQPKEEQVKAESTVVVQATPGTVEERNVNVVKKQEFSVEGECRLDVETTQKTETKTVKKIVKKASGEPPRFSQPIQPQVVREGETITFTGIVSGAPQPEIAWLKDKKEMTQDARIKFLYDIPTNTCKLVMTNATEADVGVYSCRASNPAGRATCTANVVVVPPDAEVTVTEKTTSVKKEKITVVGDQETRLVETSPSWHQQLFPQMEANEGTNVTLECKVDAEPAPEITWYFNGGQILPSPRYEIRFNEGITSLTIISATPLDSGEYICRAINKLGDINTKTILTIRSLTQQPVAQPSQQPSGPVPQQPIVPQTVSTVQTKPSLAPEAPAPMTEPCAVIPLGPRSATLQIDMPARFAPGQPEAPRFTMPLRDLTVNDGDRASFKVMFRGMPKPTISWFFNAQPIQPSADFQIKIDVNQGESTLIIKEVFPDDEGEYMVKAENPLGAAVTHCHLFVRLPSSSDDEVEKLYSKSTEVVRLQQPIQVKQRSSFSETISVETKNRFQEFQMQFQIPDRKAEVSELKMRQQAALQGMRMDVDLPGYQPPKPQTTKTTLHLKQQTKTTVETKKKPLPKQLQMLQLPLIQQRRFSETIAIDRSRPSTPVQVMFSLPQKPAPQPERKRIEKSLINVQQKSALRGMRMEVEIAEQRRQKAELKYLQKKRAQGIETKRQEFHMQLEGAPPHFTIDLKSAKVMDGEEVKFTCRVIGNPMPEITWYKNGKVVVDNPDFRTAYDKKAGDVMLHIVEVFPQDTGEYRCIAVNQYGRAVTGATLQVEVFEYVADSEEASASAAESIPERIVSEDEAEFIERTQAFIANMQKLRQELQEEHVEEEEIELTEEFHEETVQMADVKWQIPKKAVTMEIEVAPEVTEEITTEITQEVMQEQRVDVEMRRTSLQQQMETMVHVQPAPVAEEVTEEVVSEASEITQEQLIQVDMQVHGVQEKPEMQAQVVEQVLEPEQVMTEEVRISTPENIEEQHIVVELAQGVMEEARESLAMTQEAAITAEMAEEIAERIPTPEEISEQVTPMELVVTTSEEAKESRAVQQEEMMVEEITEDFTDRVPSPVETSEQQVFVELQQTVSEEAKESLAMMQVEHLAEEIVEEAARVPTPEDIQEQQVVVELSQTIAEQAKESRAVQQEEVLTEELVEESAERIPTPEGVQEQQVIVELGQTIAEVAKESRAVQQEELMTEELVEESAERIPTPEGVQEQQVIVELGQTIAEVAKESRAVQQEELMTEELVEESAERIPTPEGVQEEHVVVELGQTISEAAKESRAVTQEELMVEELTEESTERIPTPDQTTEEQVVVEMSQSAVEAAQGALAPTMEEQLTIDEVYEMLERMPSPVEGSEDQVIVELAKHEMEGAKPSLVGITEDRVSEGSVEENIEELTSDFTEGEEIIVDLSKSDVEAAKESYIGFVEESHPAEEEEDIFFEAPEPELEGEEVTVDLKTVDIRQKAEMMTSMQEDVVEVSCTEETDTEYTEEEPEKEEIKVDLSQAVKEEPKPSHVGTQERVLTPQQAEDFEAEPVTEEETKGQDVVVDLGTVAKEAAKGSLVAPSQDIVEVQMTQDDITPLVEEDTHKDQVIVDLESGQTIEQPLQQTGWMGEEIPPELIAEEYAANIKEIRMIPSIVMPEYEPAVIERYRLEAQVHPDQAQEEGMIISDGGYLEQQAGIQTSMKYTVSQQQGQKIQATAQKAVQEVTPQLKMMSAQMAQQVVRAAQEVTEEREVVTEVTTEEIEVIKKPEVKEEVRREVVKTVHEVQLMAPVFEVQLSDITVIDSEKAYFECKVVGVPRPQVMWFMAGVEIKMSADFRMEYTEEGWVRMLITEVLPEDEGEYTVKAWNDAGVCVTTAYLTVLPAERPSPVTESTTVIVDRKATREHIVSEAYRKMEVDISMQTKKEISVIEVPIPKEVQAPMFIKELEHKEIFESMPVVLECHITANPQPDIIWYQDGKKITSTQHMEVSYTKGVCRLAIDKVSIHDEAEYVCEARNQYGIATTMAELLVEKLISTVEQVILEEFYEIEIEMFVKWRRPNSQLAHPL